jgi:translation initiation factor IF-1
MAVVDSKQKYKLKGTIKESLPGTKFIVSIDLKGKLHDITGHISGKMRMNYIKLQEGDTVDIEMSPYDLTKGRIVYRY